MMNTKKTDLTFWYDYASNYAYLSAMRVEALCEAQGLTLSWRPFLLGPIFNDRGWQSSPFNVYPDKGRYMQRDMARLTEKRQLLAFTLPPSFPQNSLLAARVGTIGRHSEWMGDFTRAVFVRQFGEGKTIETPEVIANILDSLSQPGEELVARVAQDQSIKDELRSATQQAVEVGIFGAPSFVTADGELFWGDDRLDDALTWAKQNA